MADCAAIGLVSVTDADADSVDVAATASGLVMLTAALLDMVTLCEDAMG